jgi:hypothetical protein
MTKEEFIDEINPKIQEILKRVFPGNTQKQKIRVHKDRISFAAPCCGDSAHNNSKKRGNIILEGKFKNLYKCFNCGTCMSVANFLKAYGQDMSLSMIDYVSDKRVATPSEAAEETQAVSDTTARTDMIFFNVSFMINILLTLINSIYSVQKK